MVLFRWSAICLHPYLRLSRNRVEDCIFLPVLGSVVGGRKWGNFFVLLELAAFYTDNVAERLGG